MTLEQVLSRVEVVYRKKLKELQSLEAQYNRVPLQGVREAIAETRGFLKGLRQVDDLLEGDRAGSFLPGIK